MLFKTCNKNNAHDALHILGFLVLGVFLAYRQVCAILFDFACAKTASANAYAFKLRCAFV
ncbi:hypothetical protein [Helicobacter pylori]|uniref:hypothetical protein n=1 Tax=Helicobacter pylori TaxID=210 RepID=UPI0010078270|nr:hypothetical protein [Helicobacter pylori]RVZ70640.1 hypothetical protein EC592_07920 [Helicobacter pylori]